MLVSTVMKPCRKKNCRKINSRYSENIGGTHNLDNNRYLETLTLVTQSVHTFDKWRVRYCSHFPYLSGACYVEQLESENVSGQQQRFWLQLWRGSDLISLQQNRIHNVSTTRIELTFVPYQLIFVGNRTLWLPGSDSKLHQV